MKDDFSVLIQNRTEFEKGNPAGVFLSLPATKEELHEAMKALNITADNPHDFFLNGYSTDENRRIEIPFDWIRDGDLDKINFLAARLEEMTTEQLEKLDAVMHSDFKPGSLDGLIDHTYNADFYSYVPGIFSYKELGDYFLNDSGKVQMPEQWKAGIDKEDFGYNAALHEDGKLTDYGYIARSGTEWKELYTGQETPEKYRIMSYPETERTAPENVVQEAAPVQTLDPQAVAAANPSRPIELKAQKPNEKMKEITDRLEQGIQELFDSDRFKEYLQVMSKFHNYSFNNTLLIAMQKPDATLVAGYNSWKNLFGRQVARGAKGIKVLAPSPYKIKKEVDKIDPQTQKPVVDKNGKPVKEETEITVPAFKVVSVFDVSQTEGKELPTIGVDELTGDVEQYNDFFKAAELAAPVPVGFENIKSGAKGYYSQTDKRIAINEGMSELQNLKTLIHETAHAKLHDIDLNAPPEKQADRPDRRTREVQAESIAYAVCQHYGLDTSDYSFSYVAQWSSGRELAELKASLETIRSTASELIKDIDKNFAELTKDKEQAQAQETPENEPTQEEKTENTEPTADTPQEEKAGTAAPAKKEMQPEQSEEENFPTPDPNAEPVVTIIWSEHSRFHDGETMSLSEANAVIGSLDEATTKEDGYYKTKFRIDFVMDGKPDYYGGRQDLGDGDGTLIDHIEKYHTYYENNEQWDNYLLQHGGTERLEADKAERSMLLNEFVPYLKLHENLSKMERIATQALQGNEAMTSTETAYHTAMQEYVSKCRAMVNSGDYDLPPAPQLKDFDTELEAYKEHVKEEIAQEAAAAGMTVEEYAANGYEPYTAELPDPSISVKDMREYGYSWDGMLPLKEEAALHLYDKEDMQIFLLHEDGSESIPENAEDIKAHAEKGGIFGVHKDDWNALTEYRAMTQELAGNEATKEMLQEYGAKEQAENTFSIYQLKDDVPAEYHFRSLERLQENGLAVDPANYEKVYDAPLTPGMGLERIFEKFNFDRPEDFKGHSLSVSDVVVLHQNGRDTAHYTDSIGFVDISKDFLLENPLKAAEQSTEQNENMIDGIINNTPNTDALEAKANAGEQAAPETKTIYYTINEGAARRANDANSFSDYKPGSATAEYRQMVDKAVEIGEQQKKRVDPMYHEKIDSLVDTYARKLAENMNSSFSIEARVPSILIAGGSNFPVRKKEKQNAARDRNMEEWNDIQGLLDKIRSTGMGGISADDPQAVQKLEAKLEKLQAAQDTMKAVNAYYRKHKTLDGCPNLSAESIEKMKAEMSSQWHIDDKPYPSWALSNNNAEIRRVKGRIAELSKKQETAYAGWEFDGGKVEANREDNRLQIFFEEKPDEKTRETLKENGFRWSPKAGAWQRQLNDNAIYVTDRIKCIQPLSGKSPTEIQKEARTAAKTEKKPSIRAQLAQDKEALKAAPKKAAEKSKKQDLERS